MVALCGSSVERNRLRCFEKRAIEKVHSSWAGRGTRTGIRTYTKSFSFFFQGTVTLSRKIVRKVSKNVWHTLTNWFTSDFTIDSTYNPHWLYVGINDRKSQLHERTRKIKVDSFFVSEAAVGRGISLVLRQAIHSISLYHTVSSSLVPSSPSCSICHLSTVRGRVSLEHKRCCFSKLKIKIKILRRPFFHILSILHAHVKIIAQNFSLGFIS